jgi:hypothetical protein
LRGRHQAIRDRLLVDAREGWLAHLRVLGDDLVRSARAFRALVGFEQYSGMHAVCELGKWPHQATLGLFSFGLCQDDSVPTSHTAKDTCGSDIVPIIGYKALETSDAGETSRLA